jgi:hypothetical protein
VPDHAVKRNISPEIEEAYEQGRRDGRREGLREAIDFIRGLKQVFVPWVLRGLNGVPETDAEGWGDMLPSQKRALDSAVRALERKITGAPPPPCPHAWSSGDDPICAICGKRKAELPEA